MFCDATLMDKNDPKMMWYKVLRIHWISLIIYVHKNSRRIDTDVRKKTSQRCYKRNETTYLSRLKLGHTSHTTTITNKLDELFLRNK